MLSCQPDGGMSFFMFRRCAAETFLDREARRVGGGVERTGSGVVWGSPSGVGRDVQGVRMEIGRSGGSGVIYLPPVQWMDLTTG